MKARGGGGEEMVFWGVGGGNWKRFQSLNKSRAGMTTSVFDSVDGIRSFDRTPSGAFDSSDSYWSSLFLILIVDFANPPRLALPPLLASAPACIHRRSAQFKVLFSAFKICGKFQNVSNSFKCVVRRTGDGGVVRRLPQGARQINIALKRYKCFKIF